MAQNTVVDFSPVPTPGATTLSNALAAAGATPAQVTRIAQLEYLCADGFDPSLSGVIAPIGARCTTATTGKAWRKYGADADQWRPCEESAAGATWFFATVAAGAVAENLAGFPLMIRLSSMPALFWDRVQPDGANVRAFSSTGVELPIDVSRLDLYAKDGVMWVKTNITTASATKIRIALLSAPSSAHLPGDACGMNAVWSDYASVQLFGDSWIDRTGKAIPVVTGTAIGLEGAALSPTNLGVHQGFCSDGNFYYGIHTDWIKKWDLSWNLVDQNLTPIADSGLSVNHLGAGVVVNGLLYVPMENWPNDPYNNQHIGVFNASTLDFVTSYDISAQAHEAAGIAYCPVDGLLYVCDFTNGAKLYKYTILGAYKGFRTLSDVAATSLTSAQWQGLVWHRGAFWIASDQWDALVRCEYDGTLNVSGVWSSLHPGIDLNFEGVSRIGDKLVQSLDTVWGLYQLTQRDVSNTGGGVYDQVDTTRTGRVEAATGTLGNQFTFGCTVNFVWPHGGSNRSVMGLVDAGSGRASLAYRQASTTLALWDNSNAWLNANPTIAATVGPNYRMNAVYDGTSSRTLYVNGAQAATQATITAKNALTTARIFSSDQGHSEQLGGQIAFAYVRSGLLSANWLAAEYANLNSPSTFVTIE